MQCRTHNDASLVAWLSLAWMGAEGAVAVTAGVLAGSIALLFFIAAVAVKEGRESWRGDACCANY